MQSHLASGRATPLWLDCDPGHDDAFAILLAAHHPSLDLLGISTVHGNASLQRTTVNAGSVLTAIGKSDIPYYSGSTKPFSRSPVHAPNIHGETGIDGTNLLPTAAAPPSRDRSPILAIRDALLAQPKNAPWVVATGALTNIALLFGTFPEVVGHIKGLSIMGGAIGGGFTNAPLGKVKGEGERFGNQTPWAEFNIYCDPESARSIFSNAELAAKTTLITLDLTHQVLATKDVQQQVLYGGLKKDVIGVSKIRQMFHDLLLFFAHTYADVFGIASGPPLHDPLAVAIVLSDCQAEQLSFDDRDGEKWHVNVVTDGMHSQVAEEQGQVGRTMIEKAAQGGVRIPRALDVSSFWKVIDQCLHAAEQATSSK